MQFERINFKVDIIKQAQKLIKSVSEIINLLLTEREGRVGEYWYGPSAASFVEKRPARLVSSLLYDTRAMLVLSCQLPKTKKYLAYDR